MWNPDYVHQICSLQLPNWGQTSWLPRCDEKSKRSWKNLTLRGWWLEWALSRPELNAECVHSFSKSFAQPNKLLLRYLVLLSINTAYSFLVWSSRFIWRRSFLYFHTHSGVQPQISKSLVEYFKRKSVFIICLEWPSTIMCPTALLY